MVRLPVEYQEVEYLESSGEEYIITDKYLSEDVIVEFKYTYLAYGQRYAAMFGAITNSSSNPAFVMFRDSNGVGKVAGRFGKWTDSSNNYIDTNITYSYGDILEGKCGINWIEYNGTRYTSGLVWDNALSNANMGLFCRAINGSVFTNSLAVGRIYYLRFYNASELVANLIPCYRKSDSEPGMYDTVTKQFFTNAGTGTFIVGNDVSWDTASLLERRRQILLNTPHLATASANPLTFQTDISANLKDCKIYFEPIQEGSGDPSPDNVRNITGWDGVTVYRTGENFITSDIDWLSKRIRTLNNVISSSVYYSFYFPVPKGTLHLYKRTTSISYMALADKVPEIGDTVYNSRAITNYNGFDVTMDNTDGHPYMILCGPTVAPTSSVYEFAEDNEVYVGTVPYSNITGYPKSQEGTSLTIPFPQTIYGGYVDLVKGEVVETWKKTSVGNDWSSYEDSVFSKVISGRKTTVTNADPSLISDSYKTFMTVPITQLNRIPDLNISARATYRTVFIKDARFSDSTDFSASMADSEFAYKLATPITHQLTPQTIKTLKGINNIWSDANGNIEVKFWKH